MALVKYLVKLFLKLNALNKYLNFFFKFFNKRILNVHFNTTLDYNINQKYCSGIRYLFYLEYIA